MARQRPQWLALAFLITCLMSRMCFVKEKTDLVCRFCFMAAPRYKEITIYVSPSSISLLVKIERILFRSMTHQTFLPLFLQLSDLHHCSCMYTLRVSYRSSRRHGMPNFHFLYPCNKLVTLLLWRLTFGKKFFFIYFLSKLYSTYRH